MAGAEADGVYWFEAGVGFTSSSAYTKELPSWLREHNQRLLGQLQSSSFFWEASTGQAEPGGSYIIRGKQVSFGLPRLIQAVGMPLDAAFWSRFKGSPFLDQCILDAADALIQQEQLGLRQGPDLLALGLSATDYIGHDFGATRDPRCGIRSGAWIRLSAPSSRACGRGPLAPG